MTLREQLLRDEGVRLKVYQDTVGKWTIGVGRNLVDKGLSLGEAEMMLDNDIRDFSADVLIAIPWAVRLDEARRGVLINIAFNAGVQGLLKFKKMLAALERGDYETASREVIDSRLERNRRERLADQLLTGEWQ